MLTRLAVLVSATTALLLATFAGGVGAQAHASADGGPLRVALVTIGTDEGVDPRVGAWVEGEVRRVAAEAHAEVFMVSLAQQGYPFCDEACLASVATEVGAHYIMTGDVYRVAAGLELALELRAAGVAEPVDGAAAEAATDRALLDAAADEARALLLRARDALASAPAGQAPREVRAERRPPVVHARPGTVMVGDGRPYGVHRYPGYDPKSPWLALGLEFLMPGVGLIYTESYLEAGLEWGGILLGFALVLSSVADDSHSANYHPGADDGQLVAGLVLLIGSRLYGLVAAPANAAAYNRQALQRWQRQQTVGGAWAPPRGVELGETALAPPRMTTLALPTVSF